jgi:hypothetical protein
VNITLASTCSLGQYIENKYKEQCIGNNNCQININPLEISKNCTTPYPVNDGKLYFAYTCDAPMISNGQFNFKRSDFGFFVVGTDILSILVLLIGILVIGSSQKTNLQYFKDEVPEINDFTTRFKYMGFHGNKLYSEMGDLIKHIQMVIEIETQKKVNSSIIYDINYPFFSSNILELYIEKNLLIEQKRKYQKLVEEAKVDNSHKLEKLQTMLHKMQAQSEINNEMIKKTKDRDTCVVNDVYFTFRVQKYNEVVARAYSKGKCSRCCLIFCCQKKKISHL